MRKTLGIVTWGTLADFYGVECPEDRTDEIEIYEDENGIHVGDPLDDEDWAPMLSEIPALLVYADSH